MRIKVLNERCRVFLDLAEILSDSVNDAKMSSITWIVIILILVSILVTVTEVGLRFAMLERSNNRDDNSKRTLGVAEGSNTDVAWARGVNVDAPQVATAKVTEADAEILSPLEELAQSLGLQTNASLQDVQEGIAKLQRYAAAPQS